MSSDDNVYDLPPIRRTPPHNSEVEKALLGALLLDNRTMADVSRHGVEPEHFFNALHGRIFAVIRDEIAAGRVADPVTLRHFFDDDPPTVGMTVAQYLGRLVVDATTTINAPSYAKTVLNLAKRRDRLQQIDDTRRNTTALLQAAEAEACQPQSNAATLEQIAGVVAEVLALVRHGIADIDLSPFTLRDARGIPSRQWLYGRHIIRRFVSALLAPGGAGKSTLAMTEAVAMASGKRCSAELPHGALRVLYWCGEDPPEEIERRAAAIAKHHGISPDQLGDRLFVASGREVKIEIARRTRDGVELNYPVLTALRNKITDHRLDVLILDPFISAHAVDENSNEGMNFILRALVELADETNCAIVLVHHMRKSGTDERSADDARGASAIIDAVRSARVLNAMTRDEAERADIDPDDRNQYFRIDSGKANLAPADAARWCRKVSVALENCTSEYPDGDQVAVVEPWNWPSPLDEVTVADLQQVQIKLAAGHWRADPRAENWAGDAVAEVLGYDPNDKSARQRIKQLLKIWTENGALKVVMQPDDKRRLRPYIVPGDWVDSGSLL